MRPLIARVSSAVHVCSWQIQLKPHVVQLTRDYTHLLLADGQ